MPTGRPTPTEDLWRELAPQVLGALARRYGHFDLCEDAVQEALAAAASQWPRDGLPTDPKAWLITVASRRLTDQLRSDSARRRREDADAALSRSTLAQLVDGPEEPPSDRDDTLTVLFLCCHPSLSAPSQLALTLRAVAGLTTEEIAGAFLVPEATMAQRISRAKQRIRASGAPFELPRRDQRTERLAVVLQVLYLLFNEGYTATSGSELQRTDLTREAIRVTRMLRAALPDDHEVAGLLALMLLTQARSAARTDPAGSLVPLDEQDRSLWDRAAISEGVQLVTWALSNGPLGPYQLQAAVAAVHDEAASDDETDWAQIALLYRLHEQVFPNPMVRLNRAIAVARVSGAQAGLELLADLDDDARMADHHRLHAARGHLLEMLGEGDAAAASFRAAAKRTTSLPEQRHLLRRALRIEQGLPGAET